MMLAPAVTAFAVIVTAYLVVWNVSQFAMGGAAAALLWRHFRHRNPRNLALASRLASPPLISIIVPAHNEALTIVDSIHALLALEYRAREIVVVNDGSTDDTLAVMTEAFDLVAAPIAFERPIATAPVRGAYRSVTRLELLLIDKAAGGCKADAANAGINAASGSLVLVIDADTVIEPDALTRAVTPFLEDERVVAVGAHIGIINGCRVEAGRVTNVAMPRNWWARFQVVEYLRSFMLFRLACARQNAVPLISGAFGLFRRHAVIDVGGYSLTTVAEDLDLTLRLQRHFRGRRLPIRITFIPLPLGWTQAPEDYASLSAQRRRWRRGLLEVFWKQRGMIGNVRYGSIGLIVLPYMLVIEGLGPLIEFTGYVVTTVAAFAGVLNWSAYIVLLEVSVLFGAATTLLAVFLSDIGTGRYQRNRDLALLVATAILENAGYRQLISWWGVLGTLQLVTRKRSWGPMTRRAF
jgi:cellulose synthase/poly-beta-1,6-N-acetylglucosamine synthase-like glycosyltransferase